MASVQGYGALISNIYDNATGTHPQAMLNACHLADGTFTQLRLGAIAISSSELMLNTVLGPPVPTTCVKQQREPSVKRYFGERLKVRYLVLTSDVNSQNTPLSPAPITLRFLDGSGQAFGASYSATEASPTKDVFDFAAPPFAAGFELSSTSGVEIGNAVVQPYHSTWRYELDTNFELAIATPKWHLTSTEDTFSVFKATTLIPRAWLTTTSAGSVTNIRTAAWGDAWVSVTLTKASALERSEAYLPGWRATAVNSKTGQTVELTVTRAGLIEKVDVPKGTWVIHFHYHAPYIEVSVAVSAVSLVLLIGAALWFLRRSRRRRNSKVIS
jgi:hypothetical protein